jgi:hypothetical protein
MTFLLVLIACLSIDYKISKIQHTIDIEIAKKKD